MENVLTALIVLFIILFAALTLTYGFISAQDTVQVAWQTMQENTTERSSIHLTPISGHTSDNGTSISISLHNDGAVKLADFRQWDVIVQYFDNGTPSKFRLAWMPYVKNSPVNGEWTIAGIYHAVESNVEEAYDPGILNPGEQAVLQLQVSPPVAAGSAVQVTISTGQGISASIPLSGNYLPELDANVSLTFPTGSTTVIDDTNLRAVDEDDSAAELLFMVSSAPQQGDLNLNSFTQEDINNGLLTYEHTGTGDDSFTFKITDGKDTTSTYTYTLTQSELPTLVNNYSLIVSGGGIWEITPAYLLTTDADDVANMLTYQVVVAPIQGTLNLSTFTQQDLDNGLVEYTHTGLDNDAFQFTVNDGETIIGPFVFMITN